MEISAIEIQILCQRISEAISDYFVSGLYSMESGVLLRLNHATNPEKLIAVSSFANWVTTKNLSVPQASKFVSRMRTLVERAKLVAVDQIGNERIAKYSFEGRKGEKTILYAEFFSGGNLILVDEKGAILDVEAPRSFRHRSLVPGAKYILPPARGTPLQELNLEILRSLQQQEVKKGELLSAVKWFGRSVGTSRKFVEEIFERSGVDTNKDAKELTEEDLKSLADASRSLLTDLQNTKVGYILIPAENSDADIDVCGIVPRSWNRIAKQGLATIQAFPSLSDALDEVQIQSLVLERKRSVATKARAKAAELASALQKQSSQFERNKLASSELKELARQLMTLEIQQTVAKDPVILEKLLSYHLVDASDSYGGQVRFVKEPRSFLGSYTSSSLASRLFDEAKQIDAENLKLKQIMETLESQKDSLLEQTRIQEEKAQRKMVTERRERQWFERYRWFTTSDGRLVVGGRDATSNSIVINKYTEKNDIVFHADLHGSPFFVLKNRDSGSGWPNDEIALEIAQATVGFSRAWKDELGSADAFWVYPDQVSKSPPSGEFLARGSFFIEGKKNFVRHVKVELAVGITVSTKLPTADQDNTGETSGEKETSVPIVVCGPDKSLSASTISRIKIAPGKEKGTEFARKIKQQLVNRIKAEVLKESSKKLSIDEIIRVLPAGGYKVVAEKEQQSSFQAERYRICNAAQKKGETA